MSCWCVACFLSFCGSVRDNTNLRHLFLSKDHRCSAFRFCYPTEEVYIPLTQASVSHKVFFFFLVTQYFVTQYKLTEHMPYVWCSLFYEIKVSVTRYVSNVDKKVKCALVQALRGVEV